MTKKEGKFYTDDQGRIRYMGEKKVSENFSVIESAPVRTKQGHFVTIEGRPVFLNGPSSGAGSAMGGVVQRAAAPNGVVADWTPESGGVLFHGTSELFSKFGGNEVYLTDDFDEATAYARGVHLGGGAGKKQQVAVVNVRPGQALDISKALNQAMMEGDDPDDFLSDAIQQYRSSGVRFLRYTHPSNVGKPEQNVIISLFPQQDLKITSRWNVKQ